MAADGSELAAEVEYAFDGLDQTGLDLLRAYLDQQAFTDLAGLYAVWLRELLDGKRDARLNAMNWPDLAIGGLLIGANMILDSAADSMVWNFAKKCMTAGCLAAAPRLMAPALEQRRRSEWN